MSEDFSDKIKNISTQDLEINFAQGIYGGTSPDNHHYNIVKLELEKRRKEVEEIRFNKNLKLAEDNIKATNKLVMATWGLVIVTFLLALFTFIRGCN